MDYRSRKYIKINIVPSINSNYIILIKLSDVVDNNIRVTCI